MIANDTLQALCGHVNIEFDPEVSRVSTDHAWYPFTAVSSIGDKKYARFRPDNYKRPPYSRDPVDGIFQEGIDYRHEDPDVEYLPSDTIDESLHGLIENNEGYIALYPYNRSWSPGVYQFQTINGYEGANIVHRLLGRVPGVDIPEFVWGGDKHRESTAGQITEAIADMKMRVPDITDFHMAHHDLGPTMVEHGLSWPNTAPVVYKHLSRIAQDAVEQHGARIHYTTEKEKAARPKIVIRIAKALDGLSSDLSSHSRKLATVEQNIRNTGDDSSDDEAAAIELLHGIFRSNRFRQHQLATRLIFGSEDDSKSDSCKRGYWLGMQLASGVITTRLALHEVRPHPEATEAQTLRALDVLSEVKTEIDRRIADNKKYALAA